MVLRLLVISSFLMDGLGCLSVSTCLGSWAECCGQQAFSQPLSHLRCSKLLTTFANEPHRIIEKPIFNTECKRTKKNPNTTIHNKLYRYIGKENTLHLQGGDCVCLFPAPSQLCACSHPPVPWEWRWKPLRWALAVQLDAGKRVLPVLSRSQLLLHCSS